MSKRTLVAGGRIVTSSQDFVGDILIGDGVIQAVGTLPELEVAERIDARGKLVIPGGVDPHTHLDTPVAGTVVSDDFRNGTVAAAVGGTTTIIDFAVQRKGDDPRVAFEEWQKRASGKAVVDWAFHIILTDLPDRFLPSLDGLVDDGVTSFKLFMAYPDAWMIDDGAIFNAMRRSVENGSLIMLHCENGHTIDALIRDALDAGETDPIYHARTRPAIAEDEATRRGIVLAEMAGSPVYVVHVASGGAVQALREARDRAVPAYGETCPQYLLLTEDRLAEPDFAGSRYVISPPLRTLEHQERLWEGLRTGDLQTVGTDHAPFYLEQKEVGRHDFTKIPNGMPGIEWRLAHLYTSGVRTRKLSLNRFVELTSTNAARLFGLYPRKGEIAPGSDADLVIFDDSQETVLSADTHITNCDHNPYEGWTVHGMPETVMLRGQIIVAGGAYVGPDAGGQFLACDPSPAHGFSELVF